MESLVAEDEVQSDKAGQTSLEGSEVCRESQVGSQVLFWALPSHRTAMLEKKRHRVEAGRHKLSYKVPVLASCASCLVGGNQASPSRTAEMPGG